MPTLGGWRTAPARSGALDRCSLIVATYKRPDDLLALMRRLCEIPDPPAEVAVIDGSPDDRSARAVATWARSAVLSFELAYVRSPAGLTRQRNIGIDATRGDVVFFLDDDCLPEPGYFRAIRDVYDADAAERIGAVCGFIDNEVGRPLARRWRARLALHIVPRLEAGAYYPTATSFPYALGARFHGVRPVSVMPGCAMSFRRAVLEQQRFSAFFDGYAQGEDLEMSLRVGREHEVVWCGDAHVVHNQAPAGRPSSAVKGRMEVRNRLFIWRRYSPHPRATDRVRLWLDLSFGVAWDVATFVASPVHLAPLRHASGCAREMIACAFGAPRFEEPAPRPAYAFDLRPLASIDAADAAWAGAAPAHASEPSSGREA